MQKLKSKKLNPILWNLKCVAMLLTILIYKTILRIFNSIHVILIFEYILDKIIKFKISMT